MSAIRTIPAPFVETQRFLVKACMDEVRVIVEYVDEGGTNSTCCLVAKPISVSGRTVVFRLGKDTKALPLEIIRSVRLAGEDR